MQQNLPFFAAPYQKPCNKKNVVVKSITLLEKKNSSPDHEVVLQVSFGVFEVFLLLSSP